MCEKVREREKERERGLQVNTVYLVMIPAAGGRHTYVISHMEKWIVVFFSSIPLLLFLGKDINHLKYVDFRHLIFLSSPALEK